MATRALESAGLLLFRRRAGLIEVMLGHPGGPFWAAKHDGAWTVPKGGINDGEEPLAAAQREFTEETGFAPVPPFLSLGSIRQRGGKTVHAWAFEGDADPATLVSIPFSFEWPPRSGTFVDIPELDRVAFFTFDQARSAINAAQVDFLDRLADLLR